MFKSALVPSSSERFCLVFRGGLERRWRTSADRPRCVQELDLIESMGARALGALTNAEEIMSWDDATRLKSSSLFSHWGCGMDEPEAAARDRLLTRRESSS